MAHRIPSPSSPQRHWLPKPGPCLERQPTMVIFSRTNRQALPSCGKLLQLPSTQLPALRLASLRVVYPVPHLSFPLAKPAGPPATLWKLPTPPPQEASRQFRSLRRPPELRPSRLAQPPTLPPWSLLGRARLEESPSRLR